MGQLLTIFKPRPVSLATGILLVLLSITQIAHAIDEAEGDGSINAATTPLLEEVAILSRTLKDEGSQKIIGNLENRISHGIVTDSTLSLCLATLETAQAQNQPPAVWASLSLLSELYAQSGDFKEALKYQKRLTDEVNLAGIALSDLKSADPNSKVVYVAAISILGVSLCPLLFVMIRSSYRKKSLTKFLRHQKEEILRKSKELEEVNAKMRVTNTQLSKTVDKQTTELKNAIDELDTFLYNTSHNLRGPLTSIMGLENLAKVSAVDDTAIKIFEQVSVTINKMDSQLKKLNKLHEIHSNRTAHTVIDFKQIVDSILERYEHLPSRKSVHISFENHLTSQYISSPTMVEIILEELLENSLFFTEKLRADAFIRVEISQKETELLIKVADNGLTIPYGCEDRIFNMYFKAINSAHGNGLGLYVASKAAQKLNGHIRLQSDEQQKSFHVSLLA